MAIYIMRHGKTAANVKKYYATAQEPILPLNKDEKEDLTRRVIPLNIQQIVASPYQRAQQTAAIVADILNLPVNTDPLIREIGLGVLEGKTFAESYELYGSELQPWIDDPINHAPPIDEKAYLIKKPVTPTTAESLTDVAKRATQFLKTADENTLYISHDGFIRTVLCIALGDLNQFYNLKIENLEIVTLQP